MRNDYKEDWTGNAVRKALIASGIPVPNKRLIDTLAPVIAKTANGETLRRWKHSTAEMEPILKEMRPLFSRIDEFRDGDNPELLNPLLQETADLFYQRLSELEARKSTI
jgi:hypothetical protein